MLWAEGLSSVTGVVLSQDLAPFNGEGPQTVLSEFYPCRDSVNCWFNLVHCFCLNGLSSPPVLEIHAGSGDSSWWVLQPEQKNKRDPFLFTLFYKKNKTSDFEQVIFLLLWLLPKGQWHSWGRGAAFTMCPDSLPVLKKLLVQRNAHVDVDHQ